MYKGLIKKRKILYKTPIGQYTGAPRKFLLIKDWQVISYPIEHQLHIGGNMLITFNPSKTKFDIFHPVSMDGYLRGAPALRDHWDKLTPDDKWKSWFPITFQ